MARVLDGIVMQQSFTQVLLTALIGLLINFVLHEIQIQIDMTRKVKAQYLSQYFETLVARKTLNMDYVDLESSATREMQSRIQADRSWGSGFFGITQKIYDIALNLFGTIASIIILFPFLLRVIQSRNIWFGCSVVFVFVISTISALFFVQWYGKRELDTMNEMTNTETRSRFHYLSEGAGSISYREIKDILIYRIIKLIRPTLNDERSKIYTYTCRLSRLNAIGGTVSYTHLDVYKRQT